MSSTQAIANHDKIFKIVLPGSSRLSQQALLMYSAEFTYGKRHREKLEGFCTHTVAARIGCAEARKLCDSCRLLAYSVGCSAES